MLKSSKGYCFIIYQLENNLTEIDYCTLIHIFDFFLHLSNWLLQGPIYMIVLVCIYVPG